MKIGILSDTHGRVEPTRQAAALLAHQQVEAVFHCGDIGSESVLTELAAVFSPREVPVYAVYGNCDGVGPLGLTPRLDGLLLAGRFYQTELAGKRIALLHGDDDARLRAACESGAYDFVLTGHTHAPEDVRLGPVRRINPGAVHRSPVPSVAVLNLATGACEFLPLYL